MRRPVYYIVFLILCFGVHFSLTIRLNRITPQKVKEFVAEVNLAMHKEIFSLKENRKVVIAFWFEDFYVVAIRRITI